MSYRSCRTAFGSSPTSCPRSSSSGTSSLRIGSRFLEEWRTPRQWDLDEISPFERVRVLDPVPVERFNQNGLLNVIKAFPAFAGARIQQSWSGLIDVTPDAVPVIGPIERIPGYFLASGFSGHGFGIGPGAGRLMTDIVTGAQPCVDPTPFRLERFSKSSMPVSRAAINDSRG